MSESAKAAYTAEGFKRGDAVQDLGRETSALYHNFGYDLTKKNNLSMIEVKTAIYALGNNVVFENITTGTRKYLQGLDDGGVGCIAVHPEKKMFAVGSKGHQPKIYIYSYPELKIVNVLSGGAERGYSNLSYNAQGSKLASVATAPDFMLTVWDWKREVVELHSKAFGQDVFNVKFSKDDDRRLTTSGTGHIRFWKMASTFTGLKLQGSIGKFGKVELSDICALDEMPDGKVVSGTEGGALLLWEGNFIKCRFVQVGGKPCHEGEITYVELDRKEKCVITASHDGFIRWWDFEAIDQAEVDADISLDFELLPVAEYKLKEGTKVSQMVDCGVHDDTRTFVVHDANGSSQTVEFKLGGDGARGHGVEEFDTLSKSVASLNAITAADAENGLDVDNTIVPKNTTLSEFHAGRISGLVTLDGAHIAITAGVDGTVRCWNYVTREVVCVRKYDTPVTSLSLVPKELNNDLDVDGKHVIVGFEDGVVRVLCIGTDGSDPEKPNALTLRSRYVFKPHSTNVLDIAFSPDGATVATSCKDGTVFLLKTDKLPQEKKKGYNWTPLRFFPIVRNSTVKVPVCSDSVTWRADGKALLCSSTDSALREVDLSSLAGLDPDVESYETNEFPIKTLHGRVPKMSAIAAASNARLPGGGPAAAKALAKEGGEGEEKGDDAAAAAEAEAAAAAAAAEEQKKEDEGPVSYEAVKVDSACYVAPPRDGPAPANIHGDTIHKLFAGVTSASNRSFLFEFDALVTEVHADPTALSPIPAEAAASEGAEGKEGEGGEEEKVPETAAAAAEEPEEENDPTRGLKLGVYNPDGRNNMMKTPKTASLRYSSTGSYLMCGTDDGSVVLRPASFDVTFLRMPAHNGKVVFASTSYDDKFVVSCGVDGVIAVHALDKELIEKKAEPLALDIAAGVYPDDMALKTDKKKKEKKTEDAAADPAAATAPAADAADSALLDTDAVQVSPRSTAVPELPKAPEDAPDLEAGAYNIQDAKLKSEMDAKLLIAEEVKDKVKVQIKGLQKEYELLLKENEGLPSEVRMTADEIMIDTEYFSQLKEEGEDALVEVHKECEYEAERAVTLRNKVTERMLSGLLVPEITLSAFNTAANGPVSYVRSVRTRGLTGDIMELIETANKSIKDMVVKESRQLLNEDEGSVSSSTKVTSLANMVADASTKSKGQEEKIEEHNASAAARREMRLQRKKGIQEHKKEEPKDNQDDQRDVEAIRLAESTIGDYKMKTSPDYEVSEEQHTDAAKKKLQMCLLEDSLVKMRLAYNERFLGLRDLKKAMIFAIRRSNGRIVEIDTELGNPSAALWEPVLDPSEYPDERESVLPDELDSYIKLRKEHKDWLKTPAVANQYVSKEEKSVPRDESSEEYITSAPAPPKGEVTLELNFASNDDSGDATVSELVGAKGFQVNDDPLGNFKDSAVTAMSLPGLGNILTAKRSLLGAQPVTSSEAAALRERQSERTAKLQFERKRLLEMIDENVAAFLEAVEQMRADRHALLADIKLAELKLMNLFQEFIILLNFEVQDNQLLDKQTRSKKDSVVISQEVFGLQTMLEQLIAEKTEYSEKLAQIAVEYEETLSESHPYFDQLRKIYKKKSRRNPVDDGDDDEEEDEEEDEEDEEEEDLDEVDDACPPGCDPIIHEKLLDMREQRMDNEEADKALEKKCNETKRSMDKANNRLKQVNKDVNQTAISIRAFQAEKQKALNEVAVNVPISLEQIYLFQLSGAFTGPKMLEGGDVTAAAGAGETAADGEALDATAATATDAAANNNDGEGEGGEEEEQVDTTLLTDPDKRVLRSSGITDAGKAAFVLIQTDALDKLKGRIGGLKRETEDARRLYQELKKERVVLSKARDVQQDKISNWKGKCKDLQMLKFGREIDLDDLEAASNRSREKEAERQMEIQEKKSRDLVAKLVHEGASLNEKLNEITLANTDLLAVVGDLTENRLKITRDLNASGKHVSTESKDEGSREREERQKVIAYVQLQAREIEALRAELIMLKRKEAPQLSQNIMSQQPPVPGRGGSQMGSMPLGEGSQVSGGDGQLPPIPGARP
jgi:WD40 repeat protein